MKKLLLGVMLVAFMSCEKTDSQPINETDKAETLDDFTCINEQADNPADLADAQNWIVGKWQLTGIIAMMPDVEVPNIQVEFKSDGGVFVEKDGENVFTDAYSVIENESNGYTSLQVITDQLPDNFDEYNIVKGTLRICESELMIDQGIAFDAPGYLFRKIE
ncbi:hypothetical protein [Jiulongibacter sediminis]|nr:hypothetical protein [Jiulongibacter sediminis]